MAEASKADSTPKAARSPRGRKPVARKPARKPATATRRAKKPAAPAKPVRLEKVTETVKEVALAQLGLCGMAYDRVNESMSKARKDMPKQWTGLVKRGEQVSKELESAGKDFGKQVGKRVAKLPKKADLEARVGKVRDVVGKLRARLRKAA